MAPPAPWTGSTNIAANEFSGCCESTRFVPATSLYGATTKSWGRTIDLAGAGTGKLIVEP